MSEAPKFERLIDSEEAAALLGVDRLTVTKLAREGKVPAVLIGKLWRFRASAIEAWIQSSFAEPPTL